MTNDQRAAPEVRQLAVASGLHTVSHYSDRHLGGHDSDVPLLGLLTLVALAGIYGGLRRRNA